MDTARFGSGMRGWKCAEKGWEGTQLSTQNRHLSLSSLVMV